jgi:hypothetical protein
MVSSILRTPDKGGKHCTYEIALKRTCHDDGRLTCTQWLHDEASYNADVLVWRRCSPSCELVALF